MPPTPATTTRKKRLHLLEEADRAALYDRPSFNDADRQIAFTLSDAEAERFPRSSDDLLHAWFILQLGYFKAKQRFFPLALPTMQDDLQYILADLGSPMEAADLRIPNPRTINEQRKAILAAQQYRYTHADERATLFQIALQAARITPKPQYLAHILLQYCTTERLILPAYSTLQETLVGKALTTEEERIVALLQHHLAPADQAALEALFERSEGRYRLTILGRNPKNLGHGEMRRERTRADDLRNGYALAARVLPALELSPDAIAYYASLVGYYTAARLHDLETWMVYTYLLAFLQQRYYRHHDHLISSFLHAVKGYRDAATTAATDRVAAYRVTVNQDLVQAGHILQLFNADPDEATSTPFAQIQAHAFDLLEPARLAQVAAYLATGAGCDETAFFWEHIDSSAAAIKGRLRALLVAMPLTAIRAQSPLLEAVTFLQAHFTRRSRRALQHADPHHIPTRCIPVHLKRYLYTRNPAGHPRLLLDRYEFWIYQQLRTAVESGEIVCSQSLRFRSLEDDLIPLADWQQHKERYLAELPLPLLQQPIQEHLATLEHELEARFTAVNDQIAAGTQPGITITTHGKTKKWTLQTPKVRDTANHTLFQRVPHVSINEVLAFVQERCPFLDVFEHILGRGQLQQRNDHVIRACLIAWGTNLGLGRMGDISDITTRTLARTSENYLRVETVKAANTVIVNAMRAMPLFNHYHIDGVVHSSSDGQKFDTDRETVNAQHSPKYFGHGKGIVVPTLVINHVPVSTDLISAHEHESHCVFDLLYNNPTEIHPLIHSTDTHGSNPVNFAILNVFGHVFAPRYADIQAKMRTGLYGFQHPSQYGEKALFRPVRKLNTDLIVRQWDNLQRIFVSLSKKTITQRILVSKLGAAKRRNPMLLALWEYDHAIASGYLLDFVGSPRLRRNVQQALNRGEQYHQLKRAVSHANGGRLRYTTADEQALWNECSRLLVNALLYYNMVLLGDAIARREARGDQLGADYLRGVSPVAWSHINFYGRYSFTDALLPIPLEALIAVLEQYPVHAQPHDDEDQVDAEADILVPSEDL